MRKFLIILSMLFMLPVMADVVPYYMHSIPKSAIGVYQTKESLTIYSEPDADAEVIKKMDFSYNPETMPNNVFALLINERKLGFIYVSYIGDDNWVEIIYDKKTGAKGWVTSVDRFQFLPWINFYNMYGRKYGLRLLKDTPDEAEVLHAKSEDLSQNIAKLNYVKSIKLTKLSGNWALVTVYDLDRIPKMGYLKWRKEDGTIYAFPNIK
jgi:hypothetical protein